MGNSTEVMTVDADRMERRERREDERAAAELERDRRADMTPARVWESPARPAMRRILTDLLEAIRAGEPVLSLALDAIELLDSSEPGGPAAAPVSLSDFEPGSRVAALMERQACERAALNARQLDELEKF